MMLVRWLSMCLLLLFLPSIGLASQWKKKVVLFVNAGDSLNVAGALKLIEKMPRISDRYLFEFHTDREIRNNKVKADHMDDADIIMADFMKREFDDFLAAGLKEKHPKIYSLRCAYLANNIKRKGFKPETETEKYFSPATFENIRNLILLVLSKEGEKVTYSPPFTLPKSGIFHPDAPEIFSTYNAFIDWYRESGKFQPKGFWVGITTFSSSVSTAVLKNKGKIESRLIHTLEKEGINALPVFGRPPYHESLNRFFLDKKGRSRVQAICGFSFRFLRGFPEETERVLSQINAPVFIPLEAHSITLRQWKKSDTGISPLRTAWQVCIPEEHGAVEPSIIGGKKAVRIKGKTNMAYERVVLPEHIDFLIKRIRAWHNLHVKPNNKKKIAMLYWNHPPGKQNIGGSYMNCFRSIITILEALQKKGYEIKDELPGEESIKKRILLSGRNVGSWAPGELEKLIATGNVIRIPVSRYSKWFEELPSNFRRSVIRQWGQPENSDVMIHNGEIIIPLVDLGNVILMPQPSRGFGEDPEKLYHDPKIYPHHQYIAFYLWLKKEFKADVIISLGKHGTHEWLPGKQVGLSLSCSPEVLIQDIPNIYPYIVDNVGEGIQAKRRGRGVIIDHLIPPLKKGGAYMEYRELTALIDEYHNARATDTSLAEEKLKRVRKMILELGLDKDLGLEELNDNGLEEVEHYILELQEALIPYGHHTFGLSLEGVSLDDLTEAICDASPEIIKEDMKSRLKTCGSNEIRSLLHALDGNYILPAKGNDPVRNPGAIPTGKNFFGFNADKVPSKEAFTLGKKLADGMIRQYMEKHGNYPDKLGIILWSTELQRNEGASVAAVFSLLGITPVWDRKDQVVDIIPIPGAILKRPRIDVLLQCSGLFRDGFPQVMKLMDRAVRMAGTLKDVENFVAANNKKIEQALLEKGYSETEARELSQARVFAPMPGAYSHALQQLIPASGVWEDDREIADVFIHHYSFAYGDTLWGKSLESAYKSNLKDVKITMHTRSSNLYNMLDNDDMFAFLGGLSLAVKSQTGEYPDTLVANMQDGKSVNLEDLPKSIGKALRTRYLNPEWIKGMKKEAYSGAKAMDEFVEHLWGFQVTTPFAVDKTHWEQINDVYVEDKYGQDLKKFFNRNNPWAYQSMTARMLEAVRKDYWQADEKITRKLAAEYAFNVVAKGVACCDHTCNNPMLNQMVVNIISLPGVLSPEMVKKFKLAVEKAAGKSLDKQVVERKNLLAKLNAGVGKTNQNAQQEAQKTPDSQDRSVGPEDSKAVEGYKMEEVNTRDETTELSSSGIQWAASFFVLLLMGLFCWGSRRRR